MEGKKIKPVVHVYALTWNEHALLPLFFKNYAWADRVVFLDYGSDEDDLKMMRADPRVEIRPFPQRELDDEVIRAVKNKVWKESRGVADWVVVQGFDEFAYNPEMSKTLELLKERGRTVVRTMGYEIVNPSPPLSMQRLHGYRNMDMDKFLIFDPNKVEEIGYNIGAHTANPTGVVRITDTNSDPGYTIALMHMKMACGLDYFLSRCKTQAAQLSAENKKQGWGTDCMSLNLTSVYIGAVKAAQWLVS
jgi:hypothetical protein